MHKANGARKHVWHWKELKLWHRSSLKFLTIHDWGSSIVKSTYSVFHESEQSHYLRKFWDRIFRVLLDAGADINKRGEEGATPLFTAVDYTQIAALRFLLQVTPQANEM